MFSFVLSITVSFVIKAFILAAASSNSATCTQNTSIYKDVPLPHTLPSMIQTKHNIWKKAEMKNVPREKNHVSMVCGAIRRSKDDLHEWSIYRQNLTSSIAATLLKPVGDQDEKVNLPYGNFRMNGQAIEGVIRAAKAENTELGQKADIYLKFGLPRVAVLGDRNIPQHRTMNTVAASKPVSVRKTQSEWDIHTRSDRQQFNVNAKGDGLTDLESTNSINGNSPLNRAQVHYASSEIVPNGKGLSSKNSFLNSDRHHAQYFSNLDLFRYVTNFNYLRYAKADELRNEERNLPKISITKLCVALDERTFIERCFFRMPHISHFLRDISFTLKGGDTLAILYTSEAEMRVLLEVMSNSMSQKYLISGKLENNGNELGVSEFGDRVAYVSAQDTYPWLTVAQTLRLASSFIAPATDAFKSTNMIEQLIQTLALSPYRNFLCGELGKTEKQRLKIAIQILKDTDILLTDNIMKDMDLYDMAFVIDYLRDWAIKLNRIAVMAVQPPTIEILTMFHRVLLIASGRVIYFGLSSQMIGHFEGIGFPCPPFKNPCDYYVDLVTHDYLTPESSIESTERIKQLADVWNEKKADKQQQQHEMRLITDELSPKVNRAGYFHTAFLIYRRFFEMFLSRPWPYAKEPIYGFLISLLVGLIFFDIPSDRRAAINARFGFIISILAIFMLPNLFIHIERVFDERTFMPDDIQSRLYDPTFFVIIKILYDLPVAALCYMLYALPAYMLSGLPPDSTLYWPSVILFSSVLFIHGLLWRYISWIVAYCCLTRVSAIATVVTLLSIAITFSGFLVNPNIFTASIRKLYYGNPTKWAGELLAENEFLRRTAFTDWVPIYTVSQCSKIRGSQALYFSGLSAPATGAESAKQFREALNIFGVWFLVIFGLLLLAVRCNHRPRSRLRRNASL